jgi:hypothetical protein
MESVIIQLFRSAVMSRITTATAPIALAKDA